MDKPNQIHISIDNLVDMLEQAKSINANNPNTIGVVRITKTSSRQHPELEDGVEYELLKTTSIPENVEG